MANEPFDWQFLISRDWGDYALLDSGAGAKLEKFGKFILSRPEAEAVWKPALSRKEWDAAHAVFLPSPEENGGHWEVHRNIPEQWKITYKGLQCMAQLSASRHVGLFPEQAAQWDWIGDQIRNAGRPMQVLNLFGYTGMATLAAAQAGAKVTHVDASKKVVAWARENQALSGLAEKPIRWIVDDALKYIERDARRGVRYEGLILDPPKFGRGPKGEVWEFYKLLPSLLQACRQVLAEQPVFIALTAYAVKASALTIANAVDEIMHGKKGRITAGEIVLKEQSAGRLLSMAVYALWQQ